MMPAFYLGILNLFTTFLQPEFRAKIIIFERN